MKKGALELLILQATPFCNINCDYCYLPNRSDKSRMSLETVRQAATFAQNIGTVPSGFAVLWHSGEPMVVGPEWYEEAHKILSNTFAPQHLTFSFQTNGSLLSSEWISFLKSDPRVQVTLSIDGPEFLHDLHRRTRSGRGTHAKVMEGVTALRDAEIPFSCIAVVTDAALDYPDEFFEFFVALGPSAVGLNPEELDGANPSSSLLSRSNELGYRRFFRRFLDLWMRERPFELRELTRLEGRLQQAPSNVDVAPSEVLRNQQNAPWRILSVDCQGNIHTFSPELLGTNLPGLGESLGNVHADTWEAIAGSERFDRLFRQIETGNEKCRESCRYFPFCGGGAPSNKWFERGSFAVAETMYCRLVIQAVQDEYIAATGNVLGHDDGGAYGTP